MLCRASFTQSLGTGRAVVGRIRHAHGDAAGALEAIGEAGQAGLSPRVMTCWTRSRRSGSRLLLAQGDVHAAAEWTRLLVLTRTTAPATAGAGVPGAGPAAARRGPPWRGVALLERLHACGCYGDPGGQRHRDRRAAGTLTGGRWRGRTAVRDAWAGALTLARPQERVCPAVRRRGPPHGCAARRRPPRAEPQSRPRPCGVRSLPGPGQLRPFVRKGRHGGLEARRGLRRALAAGGADLAGSLQVLAPPAAGRSNQRIAHELVVALDTVKKHVTHVLGKLGAANRTEAVAQARQLGLIP